MTERKLLQQRIMDGSMPEPNSGCWLWMGTLNKAGYGKIGIGDVLMLAHRASFIAFNGPIPAGLGVCHTCHTPSCVRPDHLFVGAAKIDAEDMVAKGRSTKGEKQHLHKLTWDEVREMRAACTAMGTGLHFFRLLAKEFGVSLSTVRNVVSGRTWKEEPVSKTLVKGFHDNPNSPLIVVIDGREIEVTPDSKEYGKIKRLLTCQKS